MMVLATPSVGAGEKVVVRFPKPLDAAGTRYWITLIEANQQDSEWGEWQYVDNTTREVTLAVPGLPGRYEVRLHDRYPAMRFHVVSRLALTVTGSAAAAPQAAPISTAPAVPEADVAAMAATDYGSPTTRIESTLLIQRWIQDGGGSEAARPSEGRRFLVAEFPQTATLTAQLFYDSRQVSLQIGSERLPVYAVTTGGASARSSSITPEGRRVFQRDVYASHYAPAADLPFAIAFEVRADATAGTLKLGQREAALSWR